MDAHRPGIALVVVAGGLTFVLASVLFPYHSIDHDEAVYLGQAAMLLHGQLFLHPPVPEAFRPWFFVASPGGLYPKYAPYPAVLYAVGMALGSARLALAAVGATVVGLTYLLGVEVADRRTGLLAAGFVLASPLFVVDAATFLPYAPVAALDLGFAYAYLRAERTASTRLARLAGGCIGLAFFARPFTAVLFATPFVAHALWTLVRDRGRRLASRRLWTAGLGAGGVALGLAYNAATTGNPLVFPYQAFAPHDALGFGVRSLLGYGHAFTAGLAARANAVVVWQFVSRWVAGGVLGSALAALGLWRALRRGRDADPRRLVLAGLYPSVVLGNVFFWGNLNLLAPDLDPTGGLLHYLGPYYHFDLLAPTALFAALGVRWLHGRVRPRYDGIDRRVAVAGWLVVALLVTTVVGVPLSGPLARNAENTAQYRQAYAPFADGPPAASVVFLPTPYGPWLGHPFQSLRNGPGFDGSTVFALDGVRSLAVTDAYPNRTYYRYAYRGTWVPTDDVPVHPVLRRLAVTRGPTIVEALTVRVPPGADFASLRLSTGSGYAYYALNATPGDRTVTVAVNATRVRVGGAGVASSGDGRPSIPVTDSDVVVATIYVETGPSVGFTYRSRLPVGTRNGTRRALTPALDVCTDPRTCDSGATSLPDRVPSRYSVNASVQSRSGEEP